MRRDLRLYSAHIWPTGNCSRGPWVVTGVKRRSFIAHLKRLRFSGNSPKSVPTRRSPTFRLALTLYSRSKTRCGGVPGLDSLLMNTIRTASTWSFLGDHAKRRPSLDDSHASLIVQSTVLALCDVPQDSFLSILPMQFRFRVTQLVKSILRKPH